jgi:acyl-CoA thioesterase I
MIRRMVCPLGRLLRLGAVVALVCGVAAIALGQASSGQGRPQNVVQGVRRWYDRHPAEWKRRAASCLHYLDEAETFHDEGQADFVAASRARSSGEQSRLVKAGNEAIAERDRLIKEFYACTRRMTTGDEFASNGSPEDKPPPDDPGEPPPGTPGTPRRPPTQPPERPPDEPWRLPPGFPFPSAEARPSTSSPKSSNSGATPAIVALGDSITAGYGLKPGESYPAVLQQRLQTAGLRYRVVNAGKNDDTAAGARRRLSAALVPNTRVLIIALGLNDSKAGRPIAEIKADLAAIIEEAQRRKLGVLLCGFNTTLAFDDAYERQFKEMYPALAAQYRVALIPDLLSIVWNSNGMTSDGFHPNATGARFIASQIFRALKPLLSSPQR